MLVKSLADLFSFSSVGISVGRHLQTILQAIYYPIEEYQCSRTILPII